MPIIHQTRFYMALDRPIQSRPPICLSYAMWTLATTLSAKYANYEEIFYERARRYLEREEMKVGQIPYRCLITNFLRNIETGSWRGLCQFISCTSLGLSM